jgi:hypothetical protein
MRLSKRGEYGLRAMIDIASAQRSQGPNDSIIQIKEIAEREKIPAKFLEQILLTLKNAGLLHSKMGVGGGYYLAHPRRRSPSDTLCVSWMVRSPPSAASARWHTNRAAALTRKLAAYAW